VLKIAAFAKPQTVIVEVKVGGSDFSYYVNYLVKNHKGYTRRNFKVVNIRFFKSHANSV